MVTTKQQTPEEIELLNALHIQLRRESSLDRQIEIARKILATLGCTDPNPREKFLRNLVTFICMGTDEESLHPSSRLKNSGKTP